MSHVVRHGTIAIKVNHVLPIIPAFWLILYRPSVKIVAHGSYGPAIITRDRYTLNPSYFQNSTIYIMPGRAGLYQTPGTTHYALRFIKIKRAFGN